MVEESVKLKEQEKTKTEAEATKEIDILAELPKKLKLGDKEYDVEPLSLGKIRVIGNVAMQVFSIPKALDEAKDIEAGEKLENFLRKNWNSVVDNILLAIRILLDPNKKVNLEELKVKDDDLEWQVTINDVLGVVKFISSAVQVGEILKNANSLKGM